MHLVLSEESEMRSSASGFTLIEALIVVAIIAILGGIAVPTVSSAMSQYDVNTASQQVASTIRSARFQAVGKNTALRVRFNYPAAGQYQIVDLSNNALDEIQLLPSGITFVSPTDVQITTTGRMTAAVTFSVTNGDSAHNRSITVATSGRVLLH